jgi:hypothetical protein
MDTREAINGWKEHTLALRTRLDNSIRGVSQARLNQAPANGDWSPAQVAEHLVMANRPYLRIMSKALDEAPRDGVNAAVKFTFFGRTLMKVAGPDGNAPAPKMLQPSKSEISNEIFAELRDQLTQLHSLVERSDGVNLSSVRVSNPFMGLIRMNLADCFGIFTQHTERHIRQIEERVR